MKFLCKSKLLLEILFQAEATRMTRKLPECLDREEVKDIIKQLSKVMTFDLNNSKCFHNKPIALTLHSMKDVSTPLPQPTQMLNVTSCSESPVAGDVETPGEVHRGQNDFVQAHSEEEDQVPQFDMDSSLLLDTQ